MNSIPKRSQYDNGESNWHAEHMSFDDWARTERPSKWAVRLETGEQIRRRVYADRSNFEPETP